MRGGGSTIAAVTTSAAPVGTAAAPANPTATASLEVALADAVDRQHVIRSPSRAAARRA